MKWFYCHKKIIYALTVAGIMIFGILMRSPEVLGGNYLFGFDQGRDYLAAYSIVENHKLTLIGAEVGAGSAGINGLFHGPGYYYLIALMYKIFGGDPYGGLVLMFIFGVGALVAGYICLTKMFGMLTGLIGLALLSVSPLIVPQSRFVWNHHPTTFFIILTLYLVYFIPKNPQLFAPVALFLAGSIYHFELAIAVPVVLAIILSLIVIYRIRDVKIYFYSLGAVIAAFAPFILFEMRHGFMAFRSLIHYSTTNSLTGGMNNGWQTRLVDHFGSYLWNARNSFVIDFGFLSPRMYTGLIVGMLIVAIYIAFFRKKEKSTLYFRFLLLLLGVSYGVFYFLNNTIWDYYLIHAHVVYILFFSYIFIYCLRHLYKSLGAKFFTGVLIIFCLSMAQGAVKRLYLNYAIDYSDYGGIEKIKGKRAVIDEVYKEAWGQPFNAFVFTAPIYTYPYDYLFATYGKTKYGYEPGKEKKETVYLIIEPDGKGWYKGWLDTVIKDGNIVSTKTFHTGHMIQVRQFP